MNPSEIAGLAKLAQLQIDNDVLEETAKSITEVLKLIDTLQAADTASTTPMAHPLDALQRLRPDKVTERDVREQFQAIAPESEEGLYLVPKVIE